MRTSIFLAAWSFALLLLPAERVAGQDGLPTDKPSIFFSASPNVSPDGVPEKPLRKLNLRPNQDVTYFVYAYNPSKDKASVKVQLVSGVAGKLVVAAEKIVEVPGKHSVRVPLTADKAQLPPALPPAIGADGKPIPVPASAIVLGANPFVRAVVGEGDAALEDKGATITRVDVGGYADIKVAGASANNGKLKVTVTRKDVKLVGEAISVKLTPRLKNGEPIDAARLAVKDNVLEGLLAIATDADGAQTVELTLDTNGLPADGFADLSIDGYARTGWYAIDGKNATPPFGISAPAAAIPGKPIVVRLLAPGDGTDLKVIFNRTGAAFEKDAIPAGAEVKSLPAPRNESVGVRIGDNGEAVFVTKSEDWVVSFGTQGVFGPRDFIARNGKTNSPATTVKFDSSPPRVDVLNAESVDPKKASQRVFRPGQKVRVFATGKDDESDIDESKGVLLYMGEKPGADGKVPPGSQVELVKVPKNGRFEAEFVIPANTATSKVKIGAIVVNNVGLTSAQNIDGGGEKTIDVDFTPPEVSVLEFDPPTKPLGSYKPGDTVRLIASAVDPDSGIDVSDDVIFFIGDPPGADGKPVQTTIQPTVKATGVIKGRTGPNGEYFYAASLTLPTDIKKETDVKVGVMFVNKAGLYGSRVATLKLDKDFTTALVKVKVTQGGNERLQPGVKVWLVDQFGNVADEGKTDECGIAAFEKVLPGTYLIWAVKDADQNSQDYKTVVVRGGDEKEVGLSVRRQLSPPIKPPKEPRQ